MRSSDFGGGSVEERMRQHARDEASSTRPRAACVAVAVERRAGARAHEIVDQRIARAGVAGDRDRPPSTKVTLATPPILSTAIGCGRSSIARQRAMKDRHQRRALPAGRDIGGAEIIRRPECRAAAPAPRRRRSARSACASGRCSTVWPWKPTTSTLAASMRSAVEEAPRPPRHARAVTKASASAEHARPRGAVGQRGALRPAPGAAAPARRPHRAGSRSARTRRSARRRSRSAPHRRRRARCRSSARSPAQPPTPVTPRFNPRRTCYTTRHDASEQDRGHSQ